MSKAAGISRQAFHKNYLHLKPYLSGHKKVDELLLNSGVEASKIVLQSNALVRRLQSELEEIKSSEQDRYREFESSVYTTLMNGDVLTHRAKELTSTLKKKAIHNEILKRELLELEARVSLHVDEAPKLEPPPAKPRNASIQSFKPNLASAFSKYSASQDVSEYLQEKQDALDRMLEKVSRLLRQGRSNVTVFQDRYLCSFDKFVEREFVNRHESMIVICLPLATRADIRSFVGKLKGFSSLHLYVPFCESEAVIKGQRRFLLDKVPDIEVAPFAKEPLPTIYDGFDRVIAFKVTQGD